MIKRNKRRLTTWRIELNETVLSWIHRVCSLLGCWMPPAPSNQHRQRSPHTRNYKSETIICETGSSHQTKADSAISTSHSDQMGRTSKRSQISVANTRKSCSTHVGCMRWPKR